MQSGIHDQFVEELSNAVRDLKQGDGFDEGVDQGPLINIPALAKVRSTISVLQLCNVWYLDRL